MGRSAYRGARALLLCLAVLGLTYLVDRIPVWLWHDAAQVVARFVAFGGAAIVLARSGTSGLSPVKGLRSTVRLVCWVTAAGAAALCVPPALRPTALVLLSAWVEELVFRRELPVALARQSEVSPTSADVRAGAVLLAQVTFAACHLVVRRHPAPFGNGLPVVGLFASGGFLAILARAGGLPLAVTAHFALNELKRTGALGPFAAPSRGVLLLGAAVAALAVVVASPAPGVSGRARLLPGPWARPADGP